MSTWDLARLLVPFDTPQSSSPRVALEVTAFGRRDVQNGSRSSGLPAGEDLFYAQFYGRSGSAAEMQLSLKLGLACIWRAKRALCLLGHSGHF